MLLVSLLTLLVSMTTCRVLVLGEDDDELLSTVDNDELGASGIPLFKICAAVLVIFARPLSSLYCTSSVPLIGTLDDNRSIAVSCWTELEGAERLPSLFSVRRIRVLDLCA